MAVGILEGLIAWALSIITTYGPYSVFLAVLLEEILVPIPSAVIVMGAGFLLIPQGISFFEAVTQVILIIVIPASIAGTIGSFFTYGIGYYGGQPLITKLKPFLGVSWEEIKNTEKRFGKGNKIWVMIVVLRAIPFFPIALISLASGVLRLDWKKYAIATFIGSVPRTFTLGMAGWYFGTAYESIAGNLNTIEDVVFVIVSLALMFFVYSKRHHVKNMANHFKKKGA